MNTTSTAQSSAPEISLDIIRAKLDDLRAEFQRGETELTAVERRRFQITETLLQLRGAIHALAELETETTASDESRGAAVA